MGIAWSSSQEVWAMTSALLTCAGVSCGRPLLLGFLTQWDGGWRMIHLLRDKGMLGETGGKARPACSVSSDARCKSPVSCRSNPGMGQCPLMWARGNVGCPRVPSSGVVGVAVEWGSWRGGLLAGGTRETKPAVCSGGG